MRLSERAERREEQHKESVSKTEDKILPVCLRVTRDQGESVLDNKITLLFCQLSQLDKSEPEI